VWPRAEWGSRLGCQQVRSAAPSRHGLILHGWDLLIIRGLPESTSHGVCSRIGPNTYVSAIGEMHALRVNGRAEGGLVRSPRESTQEPIEASSDAAQAVQTSPRTTRDRSDEAKSTSFARESTWLSWLSWLCEASQSQEAQGCPT
jgi:hypothetical protein